MPGPQLPPARVRWRKASYSGDQGACVEVAALSTAVTDTIGVRDSKDPHGPILTLDRTTAAVLARAIRAGDLDL
jgi:hypothetical protein